LTVRGAMQAAGAVLADARFELKRAAAAALEHVHHRLCGQAGVALAPRALPIGERQLNRVVAQLLSDEDQVGPELLNRAPAVALESQPACKGERVVNLLPHLQ
jgi:hypothetical protein